MAASARACAVCVMGVVAMTAATVHAQSAAAPAPGAQSAATHSAATQSAATQSASAQSASMANAANANAPVAAPIGDPLANLRMVPIDPGTEDVSNLWTGSRQMPVDLRTPLNFDKVYRVEGDLSRLGVLGVSAQQGQAMYARASGGMIAIFPRSEYVRTKQGTVPVVPANTTFLLGSIRTLGQAAPTGGDAPSATAASAAQRVDLRANATPVAEVAKEPAAKREAATIWTSEVMRRSRLAALLDEAKGAEAGKNEGAAAMNGATTPASSP